MTGKKKRRKEPEGTEELRLSLMINKRFGMKLYSYTRIGLSGDNLIVSDASGCLSR